MGIRNHHAQMVQRFCALDQTTPSAKRETDAVLPRPPHHGWIFTSAMWEHHREQGAPQALKSPSRCLGALVALTSPAHMALHSWR